MEVALTVLGQDQPGVGATLIQALVDAGAELKAARSGTIAGRFAFIVVVESEGEGEALHALQPACEKFDLDVMASEVAAAPVQPRSGERALLSCYGPTGPEVLGELLDVLRRFDINVEDFHFELQPTRGTPRMQVGLEMSMPSDVDREAVLSELHELEERTGLESSLKSDLGYLV